MIEERPIVPSVRSALRILQHLRKHSNQTLTEISRTLDLNKSTCLNILKEFQLNHFVMFDDDSKRYSLGYALIGLGASAAQSFRWFDLTRPVLQELYQAGGLTAIAVQRVGDHLVVVDEVESTNRIHVTIPRGVPLHIATGAIGKCYLAFLEPEERVALLKKSGLPRFSPNTITDAAEYDRELARVRSQGYAESYGEFTEGVNAVAAPVFDAWGSVSIVLGVAAFSSVIPSRQVRDTGEILRQAAAHLSEAIGAPRGVIAIPDA